MPKPRLFIGSSSEGGHVARALQVELGGACDVERWDQSVFEPGGYTLDSLIEKAQSVDFAVLVATPDDTTDSRGETAPSARDNIVLEFGLFAGILGRRRTYLLATGALKLPTDVLGLTRLSYHARDDDNHRAAVTPAVVQVEERVRKLGLRDRAEVAPASGGEVDSLAREVDLLCANAAAQGWRVKTNSDTTLRLVTPRGRVHTMQKRRPARTRETLRTFARELRADGLRVNTTLRGPVEESPL